MTSQGSARSTRDLVNPLGTYRAGATGIERAEREARAKRLMLVGAVGTFVAFFGLAVAADFGTSAPSSTASTDPPPIVVYYDPSTGGLTTAAPEPQIRTRTS